jgi:hypothetical protein
LIFGAPSAGRSREHEVPLTARHRLPPLPSPHRQTGFRPRSNPRVGTCRCCRCSTRAISPRFSSHHDSCRRPFPTVADRLPDKRARRVKLISVSPALGKFELYGGFSFPSAFHLHAPPRVERQIERTPLSGERVVPIQVKRAGSVGAQSPRDPFLLLYFAYWRERLAPGTAWHYP